MEESLILELLGFNIPKRHKGKLRVQFMKGGSLYPKSGIILGCFEDINNKGKKVVHVQSKEIGDNLTAEPFRELIPMKEVFPYLGYISEDIAFKKDDIVKISPLYKEKLSGTNCMFLGVNNNNCEKDDLGNWIDLYAYVCPVNQEPVFTKNVTMIELYKLIKIK